MTLGLPERYVRPSVEADLAERKMVFLSGPRQVGKTTLALKLLGGDDEQSPAYLTWDDPTHRSGLMRGELPAGQPLLVLDEIHKYARWRNLLKGFYDRNKSVRRFIVTGSARLDVYRRGGDSLQGRYHPYRLHPFSVGELGASADAVGHLLRYGGFPEPCSKGSEKFLRRWQKERQERVLYEDLRDLERVREVSLLELLADALPPRVGSPLSVKALAGNLNVASATAERWVEIFERLFVCFRISPYGTPRIRAVKKERKLYFWDWSVVDDPGARFENLVACQLLKLCHFLEDAEGHRMELRFVRDFDGREVDFVVLRDRKPWFAVECKTGEKNPAPALRYVRERSNIPAFYQVHLGARDYGDADVSTRVVPLHVFCREIGAP